MIKGKLKRKLVDLANTFAEEHPEFGTEEFETAINGADVVVGVFRDVTAPDGVGMLTIKGEAGLDEIHLSGIARPKKVVAIRCREAEEAWAMRKAFGDGRNAN